MKLYTYWRSSASYRLRIALNLKGVAASQIEISLHPDDKEHLGAAYAAKNPQRRVPAIETAGEVVGQSMAILEWLDETYPDPPLLPVDPLDRLKARAFADVVACDIHPLNNVSVLGWLRDKFDADKEGVGAWYAHWIQEGFATLEQVAAGRPDTFLFGASPGLAEICLVPQIYNARRFDVDLSAFPNLLEVDAACLKLNEFKNAAPEAVKPI